MKSLRRKSSGTYHRYLRSGAWFARRKAWFNTHIEADGQVGCAVCRVRLTLATAQLHHTEYAGVTKDAQGRWVADEADEDLLAMCGPCHEDLHEMFDTNKGWMQMGRRAATTTAIGKLQRQLAKGLLALMDHDQGQQ